MAQQPDPVAEFALFLRLLGKYHRNVPAELRDLADDCAMLTTERVVIGLRSTWVRKVALPVWKVALLLATDEGTPYDRGQRALDVLRQCKDDALTATCAAYIAQAYLTPNMPAAQAITDAPRTGELPLED